MDIAETGEGGEYARIIMNTFWKRVIWVVGIIVIILIVWTIRDLSF